MGRSCRTASRTQRRIGSWITEHVMGGYAAWCSHVLVVCQWRGSGMVLAAVMMVLAAGDVVVTVSQ